MRVPNNEVSRFGRFELRHHTGELFKNGKPVALQGQPARLLAALVESGGKVVTREELQRLLWPDASYGDFEASLNTAVKKIRLALSDSSRNAKFIQTVHREGYRFIAPVERDESPVVAATTPRFRFSGLIWLAPLLAAAALLLWRFTPGPEPRIRRYTQLTHDGLGKLEPMVDGLHGALVTDGARVYFSAIWGTRIVLSQVAVEGGETLPASESKAALVVEDISPNKAEILAADFYRPTPDMRFWILPLPGGTPYPFGDFSGHDGTWSRDGTTFVYADGNDILAASRDGGAARKLVACRGQAYWLRFSPDGKRLRFTLQEPNAVRSIWEAPSNGGQAHRVFDPSPDDPDECCGSWSPDGKFYVFQSGRQGKTGLWAVREPRQPFGRREAAVSLTDSPLRMSAPVFSPDGRRIFAIGTQRRGELVRYDAAQDDFRLFLGGISADHVEFSRDQKWIAYASYPEGVIWRSRVDGSERLRLSDPSMIAWFPRWSPDGRRIAFTATSPGKPIKIYVVASDGGNPEVLPGGTATAIDPNWSPDGNSIMISTQPVASGRPGVSSIEIIDLKTHNRSLLPGAEGLSAPRWSPDGRYVVATALSQDKWRSPGVLIFDFRSGKWTVLESDPIDNKWWSADGRYFYFDKYVDNDPAIFRIRTSNHHLERVASLKDMRRSPGLMGWWMGLTPDGAPMILRDTSIQEVYALDWDEAH